MKKIVLFSCLTIALIYSAQETVMLPNGISVSKEHFNKIYAGVKEIFGTDAHNGDQVIDVNFLKELFKNQQNVWFFISKEILYRITQTNDRVNIGELDREIRTVCYRLIDNTPDANYYFPCVIPGYQLDLSFKLDAIGLNSEAFAILNAIIARKSPQHVPYLKELTELGHVEAEHNC